MCNRFISVWKCTVGAVKAVKGHYHEKQVGHVKKHPEIRLPVLSQRTVNFTVTQLRCFVRSAAARRDLIAFG